MNTNAQKLGSLGGKARARSLSKVELSAHAKKMVNAREARKLTKGVSLMKSPTKE